MKAIILASVICLLAGCAATPQANPEQPAGATSMRLGNFCLCLAVKDLAASRAFYEKLGFRQVSGDASQNWLVLQNGTSKIGLFQGMFPTNMITFNPGWDSNGKPIADFDDIREIQKMLKSRGLTPSPEADPSTNGPAYLMLTDPDGNPILLDQHVPAPGA